MTWWDLNLDNTEKPPLGAWNFWFDQIDHTHIHRHTLRFERQLHTKRNKESRNWWHCYCSWMVPGAFAHASLLIAFCWIQGVISFLCILYYIHTYTYNYNMCTVYTYVFPQVEQEATFPRWWAATCGPKLLLWECLNSILSVLDVWGGVREDKSAGPTTKQSLLDQQK